MSSLRQPSRCRVSGPQGDRLSGGVQDAGQRPGPVLDRREASGDQQCDGGGLTAVRYDVGQVAQ